jgi:hypothetical protein
MLALSQAGYGGVADSSLPQQFLQGSSTRLLTAPIAKVSG